MTDMEEISNRQDVPFSLSGRQLELFNILTEKDEQLADMYKGAIVVLSQGSNPDRIALAAHDIRELLEKFPRLANVPMVAHKESLTPKVRELEDIWRNESSRTECFDNPGWSGTIDGPLVKILKKLEEFFQWFEEHQPRRKVEITETFRGLDNYSYELPQTIEDSNVRRWREFQDFFVSVAHHGKLPEDQEFMERLNKLEDILLDLLHPEPVEDLEAIDNIIREGEQDA